MKKGRALSFPRYGVWICLAFLALSCSGRGGRPAESTAPPPSAVKGLETSPAAEADTAFKDQLRRVLDRAEIPAELSLRILDAASGGPRFILDLLSVLEGDPYLWILVDKGHPLAEDYEPGDLVELQGPSYLVNRSGLLLRRPAAEALAEMTAAARADGVSLPASSAYRSYAYQAEVYARNVRESGQEIADRESARPGHSQHQLGLVVDFGAIDDSFADTPAGRWILANAARFGWSLSFPQGYEALTGYRWESWHYRYVGRELAAFIDAYFDGIQQYALRFLHEWVKESGTAAVQEDPGRL